MKRIQRERTQGQPIEFSLFVAANKRVVHARVPVERFLCQYKLLISMLTVQSSK